MNHSPAGIRLQVLFTSLAANVVHWCRPWLKDCSADPSRRVSQVLNSPKHFVRAETNTPALVQQTDSGTLVLFGLRTALPGAASMLRGVPTYVPSTVISLRRAATWPGGRYAGLPS